MKEVVYSPLSLDESFKASFNNEKCLVKSDRDRLLETSVSIEGSKLRLKKLQGLNEDETLTLITLEYILGHKPELTEVELADALTLTSLENTFLRSEFFQLPNLWHHKGQYEVSPERWTETNGRQHPVRPEAHKGIVYRRYLPQLEKTISFRLIQMSDLDTFHEWHNQPRVYHFWELNQSKEELKAYIEKSLQDKHQIPMIVDLDGEPVGYYEMYWVREDRLGPYYESDAFDRGFHFLIGNKKVLGHKTTDSIIKSGLHTLFLDDARTRRIMAEPRHDNQKVLKYAEASVGWRKVKIFDFPHKRAWLLENSREIFFGGNAL